MDDRGKHIFSTREPKTSWNGRKIPETINWAAKKGGEKKKSIDGGGEGRKKAQ